MSTQTPDSFESLYEATSPRVFAYVRRHTDATEAPDLVAEVYLIAWKRRRTIPDDPLPWLIGVARNTMHRFWRTRSRQDRLTAEMAGIEALAALSPATVEERLALTTAFAMLSEEDRETLLLVGWDGLTPKEAAGVLGCSANTFAARLSRARRRLSSLTEEEPRLRLVPQPTGDPR